MDTVASCDEEDDILESATLINEIRLAAEFVLTTNDTPIELT
jgi:hypothetical protein